MSSELSPADRLWTPELRCEVSDICEREMADIDGVVDVLQELGKCFESLKDEATGNNPVLAFNDLYCQITRGVKEGEFPEFIVVLDVEFAKLYVEALRHWVDPKLDSGLVPEAWQFLLELHWDGHVHSDMEGAMLGVNAHINHDLSIALIRTIRKLGLKEPTEAHRPQYDRINKIFKSNIKPIWAAVLENHNEKLKKKVWQKINKVLGNGDEVLIYLGIEWMREQAWRRAAVDWSVEPIDLPKSHFPTSLAWAMLTTTLFFVETEVDIEITDSTARFVETDGHGNVIWRGDSFDIF